MEQRDRMRESERYLIFQRTNVTPFVWLRGSQRLLLARFNGFTHDDENMEKRE